MNAKIDVTNVILESQRIILRAWQLSDVDDLFEYASVPGVGEMAGWPHHKEKGESAFRVSKFINEKHTFAIVYKENNKVIGSLGLDPYGAEDKLTEFNNYQGREIGYVLSKDYWGKGIMPEAVKLVIDYLFNELNYDFLLCGRYDRNTRSARVQEKCGFKPYHRLIFDTAFGEKEPGILSLLINPNKNIELNFSRPETLIYNITFRNYENSDYQMLCDFLIDVNKDDKSHINWNWARLEWMIEHPEFDKSLSSSIGLWFDGDKLVGLAIYDMYFGEASCITLPSYKHIYPDVLIYAYNHLKDENGLGISVNNNNEFEIDQLVKHGFDLSEQKETVVAIDLNHEFEQNLAKNLTFAEINPILDMDEIQWVIYQGFDHGSDKEAFEKEKVDCKLRPHANSYLTLFVANEKGEKIAFCSLWYDPRTDYAYLEPLCVIPEYRKQGVARALVYELLNRARSLGANKAYVISDTEFYKRLGFKVVEGYSFYWKK